MEQKAIEQLEAMRKDNPQVDLLLREHRTLDDQVGELANKSFLTTEEEVELHRLKKEKLKLKDKIEDILQQ